MSNKKRFLPYAFNENGVAMLSGILNTERAISVNISVMRTFTKMRAPFMNGEVLSKEMYELEKGTDRVFRPVFERLDTAERDVSKLNKETPLLPPERTKVGI